MKKISIITPVYNEEENIQYYYDRVVKVIDEIKNYDFEIIFTDNCSTDNTFSLLSSLSDKDRRIKVYKFIRNYGYQRSIFTGYSKASGDGVIEFDCDLQDPPEMLPEFIKAWEAGNKIVYGKRLKRKEGVVITSVRKLYYRLLSAVSDTDLPIDAGDFMFLDRVVVDQLKKVKDVHVYIRGEVFSLGFQRYAIDYKRDVRVYGESKFPISKLFSLAADGFVSQSILPLRFASFFGIGLATITFFLIVFYVVLNLTGVVRAEGFTTITVLILLSISINAIFLGIIGEYLARIYLNMQNKELTIIDKEIDNEM